MRIASREAAEVGHVADALTLLPFLQERYGIAAEHIYAHNWIDFKDPRYCEGCELALAGRRLGYVPGSGTAAGNAR